jgi:hypothetical protein
VDSCVEGKDGEESSKRSLRRSKSTLKRRYMEAKIFGTVVGGMDEDVAFEISDIGSHSWRSIASQNSE